VIHLCPYNAEHQLEDTAKNLSRKELTHMQLRKITFSSRIIDDWNSTGKHHKQFQEQN